MRDVHFWRGTLLAADRYVGFSNGMHLGSYEYNRRLFCARPGILVYSMDQLIFELVCSLIPTMLHGGDTMDVRVGMSVDKSHGHTHEKVQQRTYLVVVSCSMCMGPGDNGAVVDVTRERGGEERSCGDVGGRGGAGSRSSVKRRQKAGTLPDGLRKTINLSQKRRRPSFHIYAVLLTQAPDDSFSDAAHAQLEEPFLVLYGHPERLSMHANYICRRLGEGGDSD